MFLQLRQGLAVLGSQFLGLFILLQVLFRYGLTFVDGLEFPVFAVDQVIVLVALDISFYQAPFWKFGQFLLIPCLHPEGIREFFFKHTLDDHFNAYGSYYTTLRIAYLV